MAITGISAISGEQIIAAGAVSAKEAATASFTTGGNDIQDLYNTVSTNSASWTGGGGELPQSAIEVVETVTANSAYWDGAYTAVDSNSGAWSETYGAVNSMSADWTSAFTSVNMGSGAWDSAWAAIYSPDASANLWNSASTAVVAGSGVWDGTYVTVNQNSGNWEEARGVVTAGSSYWDGTYATVHDNSASWAGGADYSAGKNISIADDVISTTDMISVTGDVQVENSTETQVTSAPGTIWGTNYYGHYASLNSSYKITVTGTPTHLAVYVYDFDHGGYYVSGLTTADLQNFTITGLSSLPNAVTSKQDDWSTTDWFEGAEFGIGDPTFNVKLETWPVASTLYVLEGSNISLSGLNNFIETNSASWGGGGASYTGDAQGALDEVYSKSANWNGSYTVLTANSAAWTSTNNTVSNRSGNWNKTYTAVTGNSASWGGPVLNVSAGPGVKINLVGDTLVFGTDETVLWSGTTTASATLSEPISGFERVKISFSHNGNAISEFDVSKVSAGVSCPLTIGPLFSNNYASLYTQSWKFSNLTTFTTAFISKEWWGNTAGVSSRDSTNHTINCIWGINRTAGNS